MESHDEVKIVKFALIGLIIVSIGGLVIWEIMSSSNSQNDIILTDDGVEVQSGFGKILLYEQRRTSDFSGIQDQLTYVDTSLGFQISRPNDRWQIDSNIDDVLDSQAVSNKKFLGGMYMKNGNERPFFIAVFDLTQFKDFVLADYVMSQKNSISQRFDSKLIVDDISPDGKWAIFGTEITLQNKTKVYGEQILEVHDDKIYMLQYSGTPPYLTLPQTKDDIRQIMDSFKPFN